MAVSVGANSGGVATGTVAVATPGGSSASGDLLIAIFESQTGSPGPNAAGWTMIQSTQLAALLGTTRLTIGILVATGDVGATVTFTCPATNNHTSGQMLKVPAGEHGCGQASDVVAGTLTSGATGTAVAGISSLTMPKGSLIFLVAASALDTTSTTFYSAWTATDPSSWTEIMDNIDPTGNGGGFGVAYGTLVGNSDNALASTGAGSVTEANTTDSWWGVFLGVPLPAPAFQSPGLRGSAVRFFRPGFGLRRPRAFFDGFPGLAGQVDDTVVAPAALMLGRGDLAVIPEVLVSPAAATALGVSTLAPVPEVRVLPTAAVALGLAGAPTPEVLVSPTAATALVLGNAPTPFLENPNFDPLLQTHAPGFFRPGLGLRRPNAFYEFQIVAGAIDATIAAPAALALGRSDLTVIPEVRVLPGAATALGIAAGPVPEVRILPSAAIGLGIAGSPTSALTILPAAATALGLAGAPTPEVRILPAAATGLGVAPIPQGFLENPNFELPSPRASSPPFFRPGIGLRRPSAFYDQSFVQTGDRTIIAPAALAIGRGDLVVVPAITVQVGPALALGAPNAPTPTVAISTSAAIAIGRALAPVPEIRALPGAATGAGKAAAPVPAITVSTAAATAFASAPAPTVVLGALAGIGKPPHGPLSFVAGPLGGLHPVGRASSLEPDAEPGSDLEERGPGGSLAGTPPGGGLG